MSAASCASSKMLHGGVRYLEQGHFGPVREALQERAWWIKQAPQLTNKFELLVPVYRGQGRTKLVLRLGTALYDLLAQGRGFPAGRWYQPEEVFSVIPGLKQDGLIGASSYWDGQMDDYQLGLWVADQAKNSVVRLHEHTGVYELNPDSGSLSVFGVQQEFDLIINVAGPWVKELLNQSGVESAYSLDLVQGTHNVLNGAIAKGCVLQVPDEKRIVFILPFQGKTLIGTTEREVTTTEESSFTVADVKYLLDTYKRYFTSKLSRHAVTKVFFRRATYFLARSEFSKASRESVLEKTGKLINVLGGKWTTSRSLAKFVLYLTHQ